jgi:murein DD-endopeptidase MepM/ murein hydrolase activator NlpD
MKTGMVLLLLAAGLLAKPVPAEPQSMDTTTAWPLCGRITENKPRGWRPSKGCPSVRFGNPAYSDTPFSSTFGPRPLGSESDRYDFHRGVDIATPAGTPIFAITDGNVEIAGVNSGYSDPLIKLRHYRPGQSTCSGGGGCYHSYYLHISDWVVTVDDWVEKGDLIGYTGASGASGFQHLHFEVRDAPAFDPFSAWSRDAVHPFGVLPYDVPNNSSIVINSVDDSIPSAVEASVSVTSNRYDLVSVEMAVFDGSHNEIPQPGNTPDSNGYHVLPPFFDMESWNFEYSHKDSSNYPWEEFGAGGLYQCPYHTDHGASYSAHVHMDAANPVSDFEGLFNGVHVQTGKYWLQGNRDYWVDLEFLALQGPAACIEATAVFASGDQASAHWGDCGGAGNTPPTASFGFSCTGLDCSFDGGASFDNDGSVVDYEWSFGDGGVASGSVAGHGYTVAGSYPVSLTVTDDGGATGFLQQVITVEEPVSSNITASVSTNRKRNRVSVDWTGAVSTGVDIHRNGELVASTANDGRWNDRGVSTGNSYAYKVCEQGSAVECSPGVSIDL